MFPSRIGAAAGPFQAELSEHTIMRTAGPITIDGAIIEPSWQATAAVGDFQFPWWKTGEKEQTEARLLWDDVNLYISFVADDKHISAIHKERGAPVPQDDCVEVFIMPDTAHVRHYYNIEVNAIGTFLDRFQLSDPTGAYTADVSAAVQIDGTLNGESDEDRGFVTELAIPFTSFVAMAQEHPSQGGRHLAYQPLPHRWQSRSSVQPVIKHRHPRAQEPRHRTLWFRALFGGLS